MAIQILAGNVKKQPRRPENLSPSRIFGKHVEREEFTSASFSGAVFNLSTTIVGAGIMALPDVVKVLGLVPGLFMIIISAFLTRSSIDVILRVGRPSLSLSSSKYPASYARVVGEFFGNSAATFLQTCIVVNNLGMLVVYMIIIGDVLSGAVSTKGGTHHVGVMEEYFGRQWWTMRSLLLLLTTVFVFSPLISLKHVHSLSYTSALSVALAVVFVAVSAGMAITEVVGGRIGMPRLLPRLEDWPSFWKLFTTIPVLTTAFLCHYNIHPIENELKDAALMKSIVNASLVLCTVVYVTTSFFGFLLFGEATMDDVLANFDADFGFPLYGHLVNDVVRLSYAMHLMLVFPIVFFSLRLNIDGLLFPTAVPIVFDRRRFYFLTTGLMGLIYVGATLVPSIWIAIQFTGATAAAAVGFIFPAAMALKDVHGVATGKDKVLAWVMLLTAVTSSTVAIASDLYDMFWGS